MTTESDAAPAAPKSLVRKLAEVMAEVERVAKRGRNDFHRYDYATEADIVGAVREHMASRSLMLVPDVQEVSWRELAAKDGKQRDPICTLKVRFTVLDGDNGNGSLSFTIIGEGQDSGDKASYKAMTGATKYALLKLFLIPTGDDPERDATPREKPRRPGQRLGYDLPPAIEERARAREEGQEARAETTPAASGKATLERLADEQLAAKAEAADEPPFGYEPEDERKRLLKEIKLIAESIGLSDAERKEGWATYIGKGVAQKDADPSALADMLNHWLKPRAGQ